MPIKRAWGQDCCPVGGRTVKHPLHTPCSVNANAAVALWLSVFMLPPSLPPSLPTSPPPFCPPSPSSPPRLPALSHAPDDSGLARMESHLAAVHGWHGNGGGDGSWDGREGKMGGRKRGGEGGVGQRDSVETSIEDLREYDVPYHMRYAIDTGEWEGGREGEGEGKGRKRLFMSPLGVQGRSRMTTFVWWTVACYYLKLTFSHSSMS